MLLRELFKSGEGDSDIAERSITKNLKNGNPKLDKINKNTIYTSTHSFVSY